MERRIEAEPPLVGREKEIEKLQVFLNSILKGKGLTVVLSGTAGTGKTRVINEFLESTNQKLDVTFLAGWCLSDSAIPYFPFIQAFKNYTSSMNMNLIGAMENVKENMSKKQPYNGGFYNSKPFLLRFLPSSDLEKLEGLSSQALKDWTFQAITEALMSLSKEKPTILFIDDLHWADSASLSLFHYISRVCKSNRILILAAIRSEELNLDSDGHPHPLTETMRQMGREGLFVEMDLQGLLPKDALTLAESMVGGEVKDTFGQRLIENSEGNPLFIVESMRMLAQKGRLIQENNKWGISTDQIEVPRKIKDIVLRRVGMLKSDQRRMLEIGAVIGERFNPEQIGLCLGLTKLEVLEILTAIASTSSLVVEKGKHFQFDHATSRETLYEAIPYPLRIEYHNYLAKKLEESNEAELPVNDLSYHYRRAENKEKAVHYSLLAGEQALASFCGTEAIKHYQYILNITQENGKDFPSEREIATEGLADSLFALGDLRGSSKVFKKLGDTGSSTLVRLRNLRKALFVDHFLYQDSSHTLEIINKVKQILNTIDKTSKLERLEYARAYVNKGLIERSRGNRKEALDDFYRAIEIFEQECSFSDLVDALPQQAWALADNGQLEDALAIAIRANALGKYAKSIDKQDNAILILSLISTFCGLQQQALQFNEEEFKIGDRISEPKSRWWNQAMAHNVAGTILEFQAGGKIFSQLQINSVQNYGTKTKIRLLLSSFFSGALSSLRRDLHRALEHSLAGAEAAEQTDSNDSLYLNYGNLIREYSMLGRLDEAEKYYLKMENLFKQTSLSEYLLFRAIWLSSSAVFHSSKHEWKKANELFEETLSTIAKLGPSNFTEAGNRLNFGWTLLQQGQVLEAKIQIGIGKKIIENLEQRFLKENIYVFINFPQNVEIGHNFILRVDIVNAGNNPVSLLRIEGFTLDCKVYPSQPNLKVENQTIVIHSNVNPFQNQEMIFKVQPNKIGPLKLNLKVTYASGELNQEKSIFKTAIINVQKVVTRINVAEVEGINTQDSPQTRSLVNQIEFEFESNDAKRAFDFLVNSFVLDYMRRRLPLEWSGWRTLVELSHSAKISYRSLYGSRAYRGRVIIELEKRGLIEPRLFPKERGRGGKIFKVRIAYDREIVKRYIDSAASKTDKKR